MRFTEPGNYKIMMALIDKSCVTKTRLVVIFSLLYMRKEFAEVAKNWAIDTDLKDFCYSDHQNNYAKEFKH